jgi:hypothetical protein
VGYKRNRIERNGGWKVGMEGNGMEEELRAWDSGEWKEWDRRGIEGMGHWVIKGVG